MQDQLDLTSIPCRDCGLPLTSHHAIDEAAEAFGLPVPALHEAAARFGLALCAHGAAISCVMATAFARRLATPDCNRTPRTSPRMTDEEAPRVF